jgi:hypothetical protein
VLEAGFSTKNLDTLRGDTLQINKHEISINDLNARLAASGGTGFRWWRVA